MRRVVVGIAVRNERSLLLGKRRSIDSFYPGYWEFPGGKVEEGESDEEALRREISEELDCAVQSIRPFESRIWHYPERSVDLRFYWMDLECPNFENLQSSAHDEVGWFTPKEALQLRVLPANIDLIKKIESELAGAP